jgi:hypothetical protein
LKTRGKGFWFQRLGQLTLLQRVAVVLLVMVVAYGAVGPLAWYCSGSAGAVAAAVALLFCLLGGLVALVLSDVFRGPQMVLQRVLLGTLLRMGIPLGMTLMVYVRGGPLVEAGFAYYVVVFYLVMLAVETVMLVPDCRGPQARARLS